MNLDKLFMWIIGIVMAFAATGQLDTLQAWIWKAQAKVIYESRSSNWGSPRLFKQHQGLKFKYVQMPKPDSKGAISKSYSSSPKRITSSL